MGEVIIRARIRTNRFINDGFIFINPAMDYIECLFTIDYGRIYLDGKIFSFYLRELKFEHFPNLRGYRVGVDLKFYETDYKERYLESPNEYTLYDAEGSTLALELGSIINDPIKKAFLLTELGKYKV